MPAIVKYNPWSILRGIQGEVNQLFDVDPNNGELPNMETSQWSPKVDIKEEASQFIITADLPGINPKDIEISMENNVLSIKGVRKLERNIKEDNYSRMERFSGSFYRQFTLPDHVNNEAIQAKGKHGVLEILIPKKERHVPKKISVQPDE
jgi:HSP20 family protein